MRQDTSDYLLNLGINEYVYLKEIEEDTTEIVKCIILYCKKVHNVEVTEEGIEQLYKRI